MAVLDHPIGKKSGPPYTLVGHSLGAIVALQWAIDRPQLFSQIILSGLPFLNPGSKYRQLASGAETRQIPSELLAQIGLYTFGWLTMLPSSFMRLHRSWPRHIAEDWARQSHRAYRKSIGGKTLYTEAMLEMVNALKVPTRLLYGSHDDMVQDTELSRLRTVARHNQNIVIEVNKGAHNIPLRHPEVVARAILQV